MDFVTLGYFLGASVLLTLAPGPDNTFIVAQGLSRGRRAAIITALGMCSGVSVHTTAAALGVSVIVYSSAYAFMILKYAGAAYLLYLAFKALKETGSMLEQQETPAVGDFMMFRRGFIMNVLNPKVALFFLAFLPQFVIRNGYSVPLQMLLLGVIFMGQAVVLFTVIGYLSGGVGEVILKRPAAAKYFGWLTAGIFASLGIRLALAER